MEYLQAIRRLTDADLADHYGQLHDMCKRMADRPVLAWMAWDALRDEAIGELRRRGLGLDGRPTHPVNVSALVD